MRYNTFLTKQKNYLLLFAFIGLSFTVYSQEEQHDQWSLQQCIQYALDHNLQVEQSKLDVEAAEVDKNDALGNYLPSVNANANNSWNAGLTQDVTTGILEQQTTRNFSVGATASLPIFHGLRNLREWQRAKLSILSSQYSLEKMKDDILLNVANAYLNALVNKEQVKVLTKQNELTQEQLRRTRLMIKEGASPAGDSLDIKATDANEKQQIVAAKNNVRIALINLAQILQINDYKNFRITDASYDVPLETILSKSPEEIIENAKKTRHEIKVAEESLALAKKDVEISKSQLYPTLDAFLNFNSRETGARRITQGDIDPDSPSQIIGQVETTGDNVIAPNYAFSQIGPRPFFKQLSRNKGWSYGLTLSIPILNGFSSRNSVKRQKINVKRQENQLDQAKLDLESNVYQAYVDAQGAAESFQAAQVAVTTQEKAFQYSQDRYDFGKITGFEFSQAKFNLAEAESKLINAKYDYIFKLKVLELYFGVSPEDISL